MRRRWVGVKGSPRNEPRDAKYISARCFFLELESPGCSDDADESINAALIEEQNMKLNQIASEERSGLSSAQTENPILSALADRLEEINLRVGRLQEASAVTARKSGELF
ncbi:hypothetical protein TNCV_2204731 [Trichonephila clavipes]|nr:hypothetical protein TNCV_2204731 [Trichonephila clavipes]